MTNVNNVSVGNRRWKMPLRRACHTLKVSIKIGPTEVWHGFWFVSGIG